MKRTKHPLFSARWMLVVSVMIAAPATGCEFLGLDGSAEQATEQAAKQDANKQQVQQKPPAPAEAEEEEEKEYERPDYPNQVRRNPFLPDPEIVQPKKQLAEGTMRPLDPLEQYGLGQLSLVAIISEVAVPKAMFLDPKGFGHVVKEGDRIGQNGGTITDIRDNEVEVREVTDEEETQTRLTTLELRDAELEVRDDDELSEEEREALRRLLQSDKGQKALQELAPRASGSEKSPSNDERFRGVAPPER